METEIWKDIEGYEGIYQVSSYGRIKSLRYRHSSKVRIMKQQIVKGPYYTVEFNYKRKRDIRYVHRIVAKAFPEICGDYFEGAECNHKDENGLNNNASNLEWVTSKYNNNYGTRLKRSLETKRINGKRNIPVNQLDLDGNFIKTWASATIAAEQLGVGQGHISSCLTGKRQTAYGFKWEYATLPSSHPLQSVPVPSS